MTIRKRRAISARVRFEVFKRDGFVCQYCGAHPPAVLLHIDHVTAVVAGGSNDIDNLVTACAPCNLGKGARDLKVVPQSLSDKAAIVAEREAQLAGYQAVLDARLDRLEGEQWRVAEVLDPGCSISGMNRRYLSSVRMFIERIGVHEVLDAAEISKRQWGYFGSKTFRYFCGVCWNKIKRSEDGSGTEH